MLPSRERGRFSGFYEQLSLSSSIPASVLPRKIINLHAGRYGSYGGFSLKKQLSIVLLVSLAIFIATAQVAPALAEHQGHETSDEHNKVHQVTFRIDLTGSQQVPGVTTDAFGMATVRLIDNGTAISFRVIVCDFFNALLAGNTYVNVHTKANPLGEIRGQLVHEHENESENEQGND